MRKILTILLAICYSCTLFSQNNMNDTIVAKGEVSIYPNPATDVIIVVTNEGVKSVAVYSIAGSLVASSESNVVNVANLVEGVYFVKANTEAGVIAGSFSKRFYRGEDKEDDHVDGQRINRNDEIELTITNTPVLDIEKFSITCGLLLSEDQYLNQSFMPSITLSFYSITLDFEYASPRYSESADIDTWEDQMTFCFHYGCRLLLRRKLYICPMIGVRKDSRGYTDGSNYYISNGIHNKFTETYSNCGVDAGLQLGYRSKGGFVIGGQFTGGPCGYTFGVNIGYSYSTVKENNN